MPVWGSYSFLFGPVVAAAGVGVLIMTARWAMRRGGSLVANPGRETDYGVLVPIARPGTYAEGEIIRRRLEDAGIRANLAHTLDGPRVLVWPQDVDRARTLIES